MRKIFVDNELFETLFEACIEYEMQLREVYRKKNNFVQGLIGGHPEIPALTKEIQELEKKIVKLHQAKFLFSYQEEEDYKHFSPGLPTKGDNRR